MGRDVDRVRTGRLGQLSALRPRFARHVKNATVIAVCRRLVQAITDRNAVTRWVKVKGHSGHDGNNAADDRATWAQNGGSKNEANINNVMAYLRQQG